MDDRGPVLRFPGRVDAVADRDLSRLEEHDARGAVRGVDRSDDLVGPVIEGRVVLDRADAEVEEDLGLRRVVANGQILDGREARAVDLAEDAADRRLARVVPRDRRADVLAVHRLHDLAPYRDAWRRRGERKTRAKRVCGLDWTLVSRVIL